MTDPHATPEEQAELARRTIDMAKWVQYELDNFGLTDTSDEMRTLRRSIGDRIDELKPIAGSVQYDPFRLVFRADPDELRELYVGEISPNERGRISLLQSLEDSRRTDIEGIRENPHLAGLDWQRAELGWQERESLFDAWAKMTGISDSVGSLAEFYDMEYNQPERYRLLGGFLQAVDKEDISPLVGFKEYERVAADASERLTGIETSTGVPINDFTTHFVDRVIGQTSTSHDDMRLGAPIDDVLDALRSPVKTSHPITWPDGDIRQVFFGKYTNVTISIRDQRIIQATQKADWSGR